jgi:hypothetical protein
MIYKRLIKERIPHEILFQYQTKTVIFISLILGLLIFFLIMNIIKIFSQNTENVTNTEKDEKDKQVTHPLKIKFFKFKTKLLAFSQKVSNMIQNALNQSFEFLFKFDHVKGLLVYLSKIFLPISQNIFYLCILIPRMLVASFFFLDVYIFHYFYYFYKAMPLLLLPLCMNIIAYMFYFWGKQLCNDVEELITIKLLNSETLIEKDSLYIIIAGDATKGIPILICRFIKDTKTSNYTLEDLNFYLELHRYSWVFLSFHSTFKEHTKKPWIIFINCIIQLLYIFSWAYMFKKILLP